MKGPTCLLQICQPRSTPPTNEVQIATVRHAAETSQQLVTLTPVRPCLLHPQDESILKRLCRPHVCRPHEHAEKPVAGRNSAETVGNGRTTLFHFKHDGHGRTKSFHTHSGTAMPLATVRASKTCSAEPLQTSDRLLATAARTARTSHG